MRSLVVVLALCVFIGSAAADEAKDRIAAAEAMFAAQTAAIVKADEKAWRATLTANAQLTRGAEWTKRDEPFTLTRSAPTKIDVESIKVGWAGRWGWITAELAVYWPKDAGREGDTRSTAGVDHFRWYALYVPAGAVVKTRVLITSELALRSVHAPVAALDLVPHPSPSAAVALLAQPTALAAKLANDPATVVYGAYLGERGVGHEAATKLLTGWETLEIQIATSEPKKGRRSDTDEISIGDAKVVRAKVRYRSKPTVPWNDLIGFAILRKVGRDWKVVTAGYTHYFAAGAR